MSQRHTVATTPPAGALLMTAEDVAEIMRVSTRTLWRLRAKGRIPQPLLIGASLRWRRDEVMQWISEGAPTPR